MIRLGPACVSGRLALARPISVCRTPHSLTLCRSLRSSHRSCSDGLHCRGQEGVVTEEARRRRRRQTRRRRRGRTRKRTRGAKRKRSRRRQRRRGEEAEARRTRRMMTERKGGQRKGGRMSNINEE